MTNDSDRNVLRVQLLSKQLNKAMPRFRGSFDTETILADFARSVDYFLMMTTRAGLARAKQDAVLASVHRLLGAERSSIRYSDRYIIACQILWHCACPETVTSALYGTTAAAALEYILYLSEPDVVAKLICDIAISGHWKSPSGNVVSVSRMSLLPVVLPMVDVEELGSACEASLKTDVTVSPSGVDRSYASHLAQLVLTNEMLSGMPGHFRYVVSKSKTFDYHATIIEALYSNGRFVEEFAGISFSHVRRCAESLVGRDILLDVRDEVKLFDLLCVDETLPLLAPVATVNGGVEWLAINSFVPNRGQLRTFNPRVPNRRTPIVLQQFVQRMI